MSLHDGLLLLEFSVEDGACCQLIDFNGRVLAEIVLPEAKRGTASVRGGMLLAWNQCGRVVEVSLSNGESRMLTAH